MKLLDTNEDICIRYWNQGCYKKLLFSKPTYINGKFINLPRLDLSNLLSK